MAVPSVIVNVPSVSVPPWSASSPSGLYTVIPAVTELYVVSQSLLPHRQLRKYGRVRAISQICLLPHRQLRKQVDTVGTFVPSLLPHRQLRNQGSQLSAD